MTFPEECLYTKQHEWVRVNDDTAVVGISDYAQKELGDIVFVELPKVGDTYDTNEPFGNVESVKAVSEVFCPIAGQVLEVNHKLADSPELINEDPYGDGWFIKLRVTNSEELKELFSAEEYQEFIKEEEEEPAE